MIEWILAMVLSVPFMLGVGVICLIAEYRESDGWAIFWGLGFLGLIYSVFNIPLTYVMYAVIAYLPMGSLYSFWRWKIHCDRKLALFRQIYEPTKWQKDKALNEIDVMQQKSRIAQWIIGWPWGLLINLTRDIVEGLERLITTTLSKMFSGIAKNAREEIHATVTERDI